MIKAYFESHPVAGSFSPGTPKTSGQILELVRHAPPRERWDFLFQRTLETPCALFGCSRHPKPLEQEIPPLPLAY